MGLVEVVPGARSSSAIVERASGIVRSWGKTPIRSADSPGFIVNRVNRPFTIEALRMLEQGAGSIESIDAAMREAGFPMGPFELMDLAGIDINLAAAQGVWNGLGQPDRLKPSRIQQELVAKERLGRKTGRGFYRYEEGRRGPVDWSSDDAGPGLSDPWPSERIRDRIESAIAAEARSAADDGVAAPADIVTALRLGAAYPERFLATL